MKDEDVETLCKYFLGEFEKRVPGYLEKEFKNPKNIANHLKISMSEAGYEFEVTTSELSFNDMKKEFFELIERGIKLGVPKINKDDVSIR